MSRIIKKIVLSLTFITLLICMANFVAFAASEDYEMSEPSWNVNDGRILAEWDKPEKSTSYILKFYNAKKNKAIGKEISTGSTQYDATELLLEYGKGSYYFTVYPKKGSHKLLVKSDTLEIDNTLVKNMKTYLKNKEEEDKKLGPVAISKLELKISEINTEAGALKPIEFRDAIKYSVSDVVFSVPYEQWKIRDQITVTLKVRPTKDYLFADNMTIVCDKADSVSMTGSGQERDVTVKYSPYTVLAKPSGFYITSDGKLHWDKVENATGYLVEVLIDDEKTAKEKVKSPVFNISDYLDKGATLKISATNNANSFYYVSSSKYIIENLDTFNEDNSIQGTLKRSNGKLQFIPEDGDVVSGWIQYGGYWYHLDEKGYAAGPGWWQDKYNPNDPNFASGGSWYYFDDKYRMLADTTTPDGYRVDANGRWVQ